MLFYFVTFQAKSRNFDGMSNSLAIILDLEFRKVV